MEDTKTKKPKQIVLDGISIYDKDTVVDKSMLAITEDLFNNMQSMGSLVDENGN